MLAEFPTVWESHCPSSLVDIAIDCCFANNILLHYCCDPKDFELKDNVSLPREICERLIYKASLLTRDDHNRVSGKTEVSQLLRIFRDPIRTRLSQVDLSNCQLTDTDVEILSNHPITELNISHCPDLTCLSYGYINRLKHTLLSLTIGTSITISPFAKFLGDPAEEREEFSYELFNKYALNIPNLRKLVIEGVKPNDHPYFYQPIKSMEFLLHLDLSRCRRLNKLEFIRNHKHLVKLILFDVPELEKCVDAIRTISTLKYLDLSQVYERSGYYRNPNKVLKSLVQSLPNLIWLDLSGTNLAGDRVQEREEVDSGDNEPSTNMMLSDQKPEDELLTDIPGLKCRVNRPLEFLGLYKTAFEACYRHHIPAKQISGEANHDQILIAGQAYVSRSEIIQKVLDDLFHLFRFSQCENVRLALDVIVEAMKQHLGRSHIQISGSASLFYIVKNEEKNLNIKIKKTIVKTLLDAMISHITDVTMIRNGCLTLIHLKIPEDVCFEYDRLVKLLLVIIAQEDQDEFVQRIGVYLLNSIACQVDGQHKQSVGDHGAISVMLQIISNRWSHTYCDEVMETAWSTLWNVTDETPVNSQRFLEGDGMALFLKCLRTFPDKPELLRNMMGLLGNVAEVKELRPHLMTDEYLNVFSDLLTSKSDGIEVSYNAAGILSHIISDGPELWEQHNISPVFRQSVLRRMVKAIESWNLSAKRNINYRSFEPILRLLYCEHAPEAQYWAIWALANLTRVYPEKYCPLLKEEGGTEIIEKLAEEHSRDHIGDLARMIIQHCEWNKVKTLLDEVTEHKSHITMLKNGLMKLGQLRLPDDILFDFERLLNLLLDILSVENQDSYVQQIDLYILHTIVSHVDNIHKKMFGDKTGITIMLQLISKKLSLKHCDDVMVSSWKVLQGAIDDMADNCERFIEGDGLILFSKCIQAFPSETVLIEHMVATLVNISRENDMRVHLISTENIVIFSELFCNGENKFRISYSAAEILSHITSDGLEVWKRCGVSLGTRQSALNRMTETIKSWNLDAEPPLTYRNLKLLIALLCVEHTPEVQYFALWAICNLVRTSPERYCSFLREDGGIPIILGLSNHHQYLHIREMASRIKEHYSWFEVCKMQEKIIFSLE